ncbi:Bacteriophage head-tail adaptor [Tritonibacter multivorans]|uniref:Bacteriophage head-tail adaptor n=1 Tax=Tritonibacter multivorans TaxID=928856 RepID=A0A0P1GX96_9RHOB|nr:head-tail adaptor protein [Tritonibacter multivorans]MDA7420428.1 head-tail adaptor protein [Tritonibacter multivorans]CUH81627.1 Bacteriophage head-tail adaptor [Tritonibacter multivorans]SFC39586.1 head-tail adaptor [Tritonibacter multivorans]
MRRSRVTPRLTRRLRLEEVNRVADGAGGFTEVWVEKGRLWAEVRSLTGRETTQGGVPLSVQRYRITLRAAPDGSPERPRADQRFRDGSRIFRITAVGDADPEGRFLTAQATEETAT